MDISKKFLPLGSLSQRIGASDEWRGDALVLRARRQAVLAGNIANADTPGYRARDISFADALEQTVQGANAPKLTVESAKHIGSEATKPARSTLDRRVRATGSASARQQQRRD